MHVTTAAGWASAREVGAVRPAAGESFVHLSTRAQLPATLARHFAGVEGVVVLAVDASRCDAELRWEEGEPGELFPHLYGSLPLSAVVAVEPSP